ncbi:MAG: 50S ribosome-binding GTPase [Cyclobacteriaceae bacterium]
MKLNLPGQNLKSLPEKHLQDIARITEINLSTNSLTKIGRVSKFDRAIELNLSFNQITKINTSINDLKLLKELNLAGNNLKYFEETELNFHSLETLDLSFNQIDDLPDSLFTLGSLKKLKLNNNNLDSYYSDFSQLKCLEFLDLSSNEISRISPDIGNFQILKTLNLADNNLSILPLELGLIGTLEKINVNDNPITNIPKGILKQGNSAILNYLKSRSSSKGVDYLYESKLVIVGRGGVGKTTLVKKIKNPDYLLNDDETDTTEGIQISQLEFPVKLMKADKFAFNIWDFAGQEKYDATHQFFLTERSLYLFLTEARQETNYLDFDYWLNTISLLSKKSPVIVVQAKIDIRKKNIPTQAYQDRFKNIVGFVDVSIAEGYEDTHKQLHRLIADAINYLPQVGDQLPIEWIEVRNELEKEDRDHISLTEYHKICASKGLNEDQSNYLSKYFHILGVTVHFQNDLLLNKTVIINPDWAVDGAYAVLDSKIVQNGNGRMKLKDLSKIWTSQRFKRKKPELLALMKNFGICFQLSEDTFIIPELLPANPAIYNLITTLDSMKFVFKYDFMPAGILTRFIVSIHDYIHEDIFWKHGVVISLDETIAEIIENNQNSTISIKIIGPRKKELLAIIRKEFDQIHKTLQEPVVHEMIPCSCKECKKSIDPHFFNFEVLRMFEIKGVESINCEKTAERVIITRLISDTLSNKTSKVEAENPENSKDMIRTQINAGTVKIIQGNPTKIYSNYQLELEKAIEKYSSSPKERSDLINSIYQIRDRNEGSQGYYDRIKAFLTKNSPDIGQKLVAGILLELAKLGVNIITK